MAYRAGRSKSGCHLERGGSASASASDGRAGRQRTRRDLAPISGSCSPLAVAAAAILTPDLALRLIGESLDVLIRDAVVHERYEEDLVGLSALLEEGHDDSEGDAYELLEVQLEDGEPRDPAEVSSDLEEALVLLLSSGRTFGDLSEALDDEAWSAWHSIDFGALPSWPG